MKEKKQLEETIEIGGFQLEGLGLMETDYRLHRDMVKNS